MVARCQTSEAGHLTADEITPLMAASAAGPTSQTNEEAIVATKVVDEDDDTPLPRAQIFFLCYARMAEPVAVRI